MLTRRRFLISSAMLGAWLVAPKIKATAAPARKYSHGHGKARRNITAGDTGLLSPIVGGSLTASIPKYRDPLVVPPTMPKISTITGKNGEEIDYYEIAVRQFSQQILPQSDFEPTTVWSYGSAGAGHQNTFNYPAFTIEAKADRPVRIKWINDLKDGSGHYLPHLFHIDQTLHWANPPGGEMMHDHRGMDISPYTGPVPLVSHVHGAHTHEESDGYPEAWYLPDATDIPDGYAKNGSIYTEYKQKAEKRQGQTWETGTSVYQYPNDQRAGTNWYHDHTLGMTRANVYAGPAGFYIIRGGPGDLQDGSVPTWKFAIDAAQNVEVPIVIQDRSFNDDGTHDGKIIPSLFYPDSREFFDGFPVDYMPDSDISPIWNPEFFGNVMVVNGKSWPKFQVERKRYRIRFLNGCNSRFLILKLASNDPDHPPVDPDTYDYGSALPIWQIGSEGGFLDEPVQLEQLLIAPAERADVMIDFSKVPSGISSIYLLNEAPDEPFGGGVPGVDFDRSDLSSTGQVMRFDLVPVTTPDTTTDPAILVLPMRQKIGKITRVRKVALLELGSESLYGDDGELFGPREAVLGSVKTNIFGNPIFEEKEWHAPLTETPLVGDTEIWEIYNTTVDAHPIHLHLVMFEVLNREERSTGKIFEPEDTEKGFKDTVIAYPGQITRIKANFDIAGLYVWHCHILEHEDNEMMRPYRVMSRIAMPLIFKP